MQSLTHPRATLVAIATLSVSLSIACGPRVSAGDGASDSQPSTGGDDRERASSDPTPVAIQPMDPADAPTRGPDEPRVIIEVYADFECPYCARSRDTTDRVQAESDGVAVVYRFFPLSMHRNARPAANAALEVYRQAGDSAFWAYSREIYARQERISRRILVRLAREAGVDADLVEQAVIHGWHDERIDADMERGVEAGVQGTPTYVVNGELVDSPTYDELSIVVEDLLDAAP